jgi:SEC-C motif
MMNPELVKPFLLHEDPDVRDRATSYFSDTWSEDPELLPLVLDACDKFGFNENLRCLQDASHFVVSETSVSRVLEYLKQEQDLFTSDTLNELIVHAPGEILRTHLDAIDQTPRIKPGTLRRVRRRIEYMEWSADQICAELQAFSTRSEEDNEGEVDLEYAADLIQALSRHNTPDVETLCRLIRKPEKEFGWLQLFHIDLAGNRRLKEAVAPLVEQLHEDDDFLLENSQDALARIGDVEAIRLIRRDFAEAPFHFRLFAATVLGAIQDAEAESAILELLENEEDESIRVWLCSALCDQVSERCLEVVGREIASGVPLARQELSGSVLEVATMLGQELPAEAVEWRVVRDRQRKALARYTSPGSGWEDSFDEEPEIDARRFLLGADSSIQPSFEVTAPIRNTGTRVGRNDPCPCGSGKKFKKCCGRA